MKKQICKIISNKKISKDIFLLELENKYLAEKSKAGQFVHVLVPAQNAEDKAPFLRRPFGVNLVDKKKNKISLLYKVIGSGTKLLSQTQKGDALDVMGPLGNGFEIKKAKEHIIISGGMGIAPLMQLVKEIKEKKAGKIHLYLGAKDKNEIVFVSYLKKLADEIVITTDDGSIGEKCLITMPAEKLLKQNLSAKIYACGPYPMLKCVAGLAKKYKIQAQLSLEEKMACGVGVCLGCPIKIKTKQGDIYKMVCKDGPVFNAEDIIW
ncbi:MAG: dihydroorotate dehydrogenase electron transfer subunit [Elusimicrobiaceae bacterium]|jgi:dihydroorotate dehydrogenase electron transfer subunit|nr:dihydroorotate dehydrogenase electron transfer subunit [Elusimicrobiaceae bacterium]MBT3955465.1 dihydroorotate dehydrogenase electron transfer subunit [Elusimicrobiaceae bacterium]MBT4008217.1 dihydroorotate dehydrogenase electron transfer subunit [Elusimicrobiaceae bacterium]MBT4403083.1 dihydroorotate dehydrogenase electron transfer subunit [Elusimicrobiaceae bacterium]MBT4439339.1 dihydroorotate dehydrogenase electron transfer subunit [Elusimicrobiaceae bacterium]